MGIERRTPNALKCGLVEHGSPVVLTLPQNRQGSIPASVAPPIVRDWGQDCKRVGSGIKRSDMVPCPLRLPLVLEQDTLVVGLYDFRQSFSNNVPASLKSGTIRHLCR